MSVSPFQHKYIENLNSLKDLYNEVNSTIILHEYITGEFFFPPIISFREFTDELFFIYKNQNVDTIDSDFQLLRNILNEAGHGTLDSILNRVLSEITSKLKKYDYDVLDTVTDAYDNVKLCVDNAVDYIKLYKSNKEEILQKPFLASLEEFKDIPKLHDQLLNRGHLLKKAQKDKDSEGKYAIINGNFQNLIIGVVSAILTFIFIHTFSENIVDNLKDKRNTSGQEQDMIEFVDSTLLDSPDFELNDTLEVRVLLESKDSLSAK
jgi:hypothetical protein